MLYNVSIGNIEKVLDENCNFENIKSAFLNLNIKVREIEEGHALSDVYLLVSDDNDTALQSECNGIILEKNTNKIVAMCNNKFKKIEQSTEKRQIADLRATYTDANIKTEFCEDGTVIRLYNRNDMWYTATTKCIDATKSFWSSNKTFHELFFEIFNYSGFDIDSLHKDYTYTFILHHIENRIVVKHDYNKLIYISSINNITKEEDYSNHFENVNYIYPVTEINLTDYSRTLEQHYFYDKRGVLLKCYNKESNTWVVYQYDFANYTYIKDVRGNVPNIYMRYLELLNDQSKLAILQLYYPEYSLVFFSVRQSMQKLYKQIHKLYFESHIKHNIRVENEHPLYHTLRQLHGIYKKQNVIITLDEVIKKVNTLDKNILVNLLKTINQ